MRPETFKRKLLAAIEETAHTDAIAIITSSLDQWMRDDDEACEPVISAAFGPIIEDRDAFPRLFAAMVIVSGLTGSAIAGLCRGAGVPIPMILDDLAGSSYAELLARIAREGEPPE